MCRTNINAAVIWDMDGVIADTAAYHFQAWRDAFQKRGVKFTEADFRHSFGKNHQGYFWLNAFVLSLDSLVGGNR